MFDPDNTERLSFCQIVEKNCFRQITVWHHDLLYLARDFLIPCWSGLTISSHGRNLKN